MQVGNKLEIGRLAALLVLLAGCFLMGGASRSDVLSLIVLQPLAVACTVTILAIPGSIDWRAIRIPLLFLAVLAAMIAAQLVPLPPAVWTSLPGHAPFAESATAAGLAQPWRPISLTPDLTLASLIGLVVPFGVLVGFASILPQRRQSLLLTALVIGAAVSGFLGLAQVSGGEESPFYIYDITNNGSAVGLFSNRNHQAVLLAMTWPLLAVWVTLPNADARLRGARRWVAVGFGLFALPLVLVTGSRAGLGLAAIGLFAAGVLWWLDRKSSRAPAAEGLARFIPLAVVVGGAALVGATVVFSRALAITRLTGLSGSGDMRFEATPVLLDMSGDFFPVGAGFGSFDPVFRSYEPLEMLDPEYLNHAHNDLLELVITAGLPGVIVLLAFVAWFGMAAWRAWRGVGPTLETNLARAGSVMILLVLLSSLVDYPLRTPLMMTIIAIACCWLASGGRQVRRKTSPRARPK
jgi:O-antigen ligase